MGSQVNQNAIRKLVDAWKSYFKALKDYKANPQKYKARPKIPRYNKNQEYTAWFSCQVAKLKEENGMCYIQFVNQKELFCIGKSSVYAGLKYVKTEIKPMYGVYYVLITFDDKIKEINPPKNPSRILGIDTGINNFVSVGNNFGGVPFIIRGGAIKSVNQRFNKKRAKLMSALTKGSVSQDSVKHSKQLDTLSRRRDSFMRDYFYKCAWYICRYAVSAGVQVIILGHNDGQKQEVSMGSANNQNFVSIPYHKFITVLKSVATQCGIAVTVREESYTSQAMSFT